MQTSQTKESTILFNGEQLNAGNDCCAIMVELVNCRRSWLLLLLWIGGLQISTIATTTTMHPSSLGTVVGNTDSLYRKLVQADSILSNKSSRPTLPLVLPSCSYYYYHSTRTVVVVIAIVVARPMQANDDTVISTCFN